MADNGSPKVTVLEWKFKLGISWDNNFGEGPLPFSRVLCVKDSTEYGILFIYLIKNQINIIKIV